MVSFQKHIIKYIVLFFLLTLSVGQNRAQNIAFDHLTPDEGLSQISVNSLYADRDGNIWIATRMGLNCYDGNHLRIYTNKSGDTKSLFCNNVMHITGDGNRNLYLLCSEGIARLDLMTRQFKTLKYDNNIGAICYHGRLYYSDKHKIMTVEGQSGRLTRAVGCG